MAEKGTILRRLVSEVPMPALANQQSPVSGNSMSVIQADTECAETLLALASSWCGPQMTSSNVSLGQQETQEETQLKDEEALAREKEESEYRRDLLKRVRLDHNYYWSGPTEHRPPVVSKARKVSECSSDWRYVETKQEFVESDGMSSPEYYSPNDSGVADLSPDAPAHSSRIGRGDDITQSNLQILLKCIERREQSDHFDEGVEPYDGMDPLNEDEGVDSDSNLMGDYDAVMTGSSSSSQSYVCQKCSRHFSKKRYLTKHMRRMHPEVLGVRHQYAICPSCGAEHTKRNFNKTYVVCTSCLKKSRSKSNESDIAACQHCGVRLRRHMLVKHLAQEHCVDRLTSVSELDNADAFMCSLCSVALPKSEVTCHFLDTHLCQDAGKGLHLDCQLCGVELSDTTLSSHLVAEHCSKTEELPHAEAASSLMSFSANLRPWQSRKADDLSNNKPDHGDNLIFLPTSSHSLSEPITNACAYDAKASQDKRSISPAKGSRATVTSVKVARSTSVSPNKDGRTNRHFIVKKVDAAATCLDAEDKRSVRHPMSTAAPVLNKNALLIQPV